MSHKTQMTEEHTGRIKSIMEKYGVIFAACYNKGYDSGFIAGIDCMALSVAIGAIGSAALSRVIVAVSRRKRKT